ncbi:MAG: hypothetical protein GY757_08265 [bacterium]|nr:hypothetical protein [bacterium]
MSDSGGMSVFLKFVKKFLLLRSKERIVKNKAEERINAIVTAIVLFCPQTIYANNPPSPYSVLSEILILPLMMLFTYLGGGYQILRLRKKQTAKSKTLVQKTLRSILISVIVIFAISMEGATLLVSIFFFIKAVKRGGKMIRWGTTTLEKGQEQSLQKRNRTRLILCGVLTIIMVSGLFGMSIAFINANRHLALKPIVEKDLAELVLYQLQRGEKNREEFGEVRYEIPKRGKFGALIFGDKSFFPSEKWMLSFSRQWAVKFSLEKNGKSFKIFVWPKKFPLYPYNYLVSYPSFFADETGKIRSIGVSTPRPCPEDAPIFATVAGATCAPVI